MSQSYWEWYAAGGAAKCGYRISDTAWAVANRTIAGGNKAAGASSISTAKGGSKVAGASSFSTAKGEGKAAGASSFSTANGEGKAAGASRAVGDNSDSPGYSEWSQYRAGGGSWNYAEVRPGSFECTLL